MSYSVPSTSSVARAPKLSLLAATVCASPSLVPGLCTRARTHRSSRLPSSQPRLPGAPPGPDRPDRRHPSACRAGQRASGRLASRVVSVVEQRPLVTAPGEAPSEPHTGRSGARRVVRAVLWSALAVAFAVTCLSVGLPTDRVLLLGWVLAALGVHAVTERWHRVVRLLVDWVPLATLLLLYDLSRGMADQFGV